MNNKILLKAINILRNSDNKKLINNFFNLGSVQILEMLLPLLTVPYITRIIGFDKVGVIAFSSAIIGYFGICINYGFNLTGTKQVAQNKDDKNYINSVFLEILYSKLLIIAACFLVLLLLLLFPKFQNESIIYLLIFGNIVFQNLIPTWFLQGFQDLNFSTKVNIVFKIISTILVFLFVKEKDDYWLVVFFPFIQSLISLIFINYYIQKNYSIKLKKISYKEILSQLNEGKYIFLSQVKISFFNNFNILILGLLLDNKAVGIFSSADKVIKIVSAMQIPVVSALFPYFSALLKKDLKSGYGKLTKFALLGTVIYSIIILFLWLLAPYISEVLFGSEIKVIATLIRIMSFIPLFVYLNNLYGTQFLLNIDGDKKFLVNLIIAAAFNCIVLIPLTFYFNVNGTAISILLTEFIVLLLMYTSSKKKYTKIIK